MSKKRVKNIRVDIKKKHSKWMENQTLFGKQYRPKKPSNLVVAPTIPDWANDPKKYATGKDVNTTVVQKPKYEGELLEREIAAQEQIERKKTMVAPLYNKGGYQYLGENPDEEILKGIGRKI